MPDIGLHRPGILIDRGALIGQGTSTDQAAHRSTGASIEHRIGVRFRCFERYFSDNPSVTGGDNGDGTVKTAGYFLSVSVWVPVLLMTSRSTPFSSGNFSRNSAKVAVSGIGWPFSLTISMPLRIPAR